MCRAACTEWISRHSWKQAALQDTVRLNSAVVRSGKLLKEERERAALDRKEFEEMLANFDLFYV